MPECLHQILIIVVKVLHNQIEILYDPANDIGDTVTNTMSDNVRWWIYLDGGPVRTQGKGKNCHPDPDSSGEGSPAMALPTGSNACIPRDSGKTRRSFDSVPYTGTPLRMTSSLLNSLFSHTLHETSLLKVITR